MAVWFFFFVKYWPLKGSSSAQGKMGPPGGVRGFN